MKKNRNNPQKEGDEPPSKSIIKRIFLASALTKIPALIYILIMISTVPAITDIGEYNTIKGAHRGDSVKYVENTLEALKSASENPEYEFIEFDIQYTKDKQLIVFHDTSLLRTTGRSDAVENLTYTEIQELTPFEVSTYEEVMNEIAEKKKLNIEIKSQGYLEDDKEITDYVVQDITERGIRQDVAISSVSEDVILYSKEKYPDIPTGKIYWLHSSTYMPFDFLTNDLYEDVKQTNADYLMIHGANIHNSTSLIENKPDNKTIVFWYFDDQMYLVQAEQNDRMW